MCSAGRCVCRAGLTQITGGLCTDLQASPNNCGTLGNRCGMGQACVAGRCQAASNCTSPNTNCGGWCVNRNTHPYNCGSCGNICDQNQVCVAGQCRTFVAPAGCTTCPCACATASTCCSAQDRMAGVCVSGTACP